MNVSNFSSTLHLTVEYPLHDGHLPRYLPLFTVLCVCSVILSIRLMFYSFYFKQHNKNTMLTFCHAIKDITATVCLQLFTQFFITNIQHMYTDECLLNNVEFANN